MFSKYINFVRGISGNAIGLIGVVLTTSSFVTFIILELARIAGILTNAYIGLVTYLVFPALFIIGLLLIPIGWKKLKKQTGKSTDEILSERFDKNAVKAGFWGSRVFLLIGALTVINILFMGFLSSRMLHFMDSARFCGTACHTVMNPEWTTYQASPHARVKCVECHVGEGVDALINSKLNGIWQIISLTFNLYEKPIPTPVHQLRPARETCEKCHWPDKFYGGRIKNIIHYAKDEFSTPKYTTLNLKVDIGNERENRGIHWHIAEENEIRYTSVNDEREKIIWVDVKQDDGSYKRYNNQKLVSENDKSEDVRVMDCVDCHNRATHIYEDPQYAVDERIKAGLISRELPYLKREALAAIRNTYSDYETANQAISDGIREYYRRNHPRISSQKTILIDSLVMVLQEIYARNTHPYMNISWGSYPSHIGHRGETGCFRCHNSDFMDAEGNNISYDCTLCHSILSYDSDQPFDFLQPVDTAAKNSIMHEYLQDEYLETLEED